MEREAAKSIKEWLDHGKEALLVTGARQIGKTSLIRECLRAENEMCIRDSEYYV